MKILIVATIAMFVSGLAAAQDANRKNDQKADNCFYTIENQPVEVPIGGSVCRRQPAPYNDKYSLLRCNPPLDEIASDIKRGDARCEKYEDR